MSTDMESLAPTDMFTLQGMYYGLVNMIEEVMDYDSKYFRSLL